MKLCDPKAYPALKTTAPTWNFLPLAAIIFLAMLTCPSPAFGQVDVSGVITDYNSFWKSSKTAVNTIKPVNSHNLLAFTHNGVQYSTGVNDGVLTSHGEHFVAGDFWSLPVDNISGTLTTNTKVGLGEMYDGVHNGASHPAPARNINDYLTDGIKGLNIGTCVANLPAGSLTFLVSNIRPENIGDGIPDILVTQVADPSGSYDRYSFTDINGATIGQTKDIVFTNITPVANWTADFYEANSNPMVLTTGFTNTHRPMRLWAADVSEFGITAANYQNIRKFKINLSGNSDVAFVAYNQKTFSVGIILPLTLGDFTGKLVNGTTQLNWNTQSESGSSHFIVEKSQDNISFAGIDTIMAAGNSTTARYYSSRDKAQNGSTYYRLKMVDADGKFVYSRIVLVRNNTGNISLAVSLYPNPATDKIVVTYPSSNEGRLLIYSASGALMSQAVLNNGTTQSTVAVNRLARGVYHLVWKGQGEQLNSTFIVR